MPYTQTKDNRWGKKVRFHNLRGRKFDRFVVLTLIAFDLSDATNAFWKCECRCTRAFSASTKEIESNEVTACEVCMEDDSFKPEEILIVRKRNDQIPVGEEIIFKGEDLSSFGQIRVEWRGKFLSIGRRSVATTGKTF